MLFVHISKIHSYLHFTNQEHVKLLNGMHEGILILNKANNLIMLSNNPTKKLLNNFLSKAVLGMKYLQNPKFMKIQLT